MTLCAKSHAKRHRFLIFSVFISTNFIVLLHPYYIFFNSTIFFLYPTLVTQISQVFAYMGGAFIQNKAKRIAFCAPYMHLCFPLRRTSAKHRKSSLLARTDVFFTIPVRVPKSKIPKPNNVRFRDLLVTRTGLEPMLPP